MIDKCSVWVNSNCLGEGLLAVLEVVLVQKIFFFCIIYFKQTLWLFIYFAIASRGHIILIWGNDHIPSIPWLQILLQIQRLTIYNDAHQLLSFPSNLYKNIHFPKDHLLICMDIPMQMIMNSSLTLNI